MRFSIFLFLLFLSSSSFAQKNELSSGIVFLSNGRLFSGAELDYFRNLGTKHAIGLRGQWRPGNKINAPQYEKAWAIAGLSRWSFDLNSTLKANLESGLLFSSLNKTIYEAIRPTDSVLHPKSKYFNYGGFTAGVGIQRSLGTHFALGLDYRAQLLFPITEKVPYGRRGESPESIFESYSAIDIIYIF